MADKVGEVEGEVCNRDSCTGVIELEDSEGCSCHINPPCSCCVDRKHYCPVCDWYERDEM